MSKLKQAWPSDAFDAISIVAGGGEFKIEGTDGTQVELEGEFDSRWPRDLGLEPKERWLQLHMWGRADDGEIKLRLPRQKAWVVDVSAGQGEVEIKQLQARLRVMMGKGDIKIEDCRGVFNVAAGKGDVQMERCTQTTVPERPATPQFEAHFDVPPIPESRGTAEVHVHMGERPPRPPRPPRRPRGRSAWDWLGFEGEDWAEWLGFDSEDWSEWGQQFGQQARVWAEQFASQFVGWVDWLPEKQGIALRIGKGDVRLKTIDAQSCAIFMGNGDVELEDGRIEEADITLGHGGFNSESILPVGQWDVETRHGDLHLALPANTQARLDVATRHGDINSEIPLVRVARPGPETRHSTRMVGTVGSTESQGAQISLTAQSGDIHVELQRSPSKYSGKSTTGTPNATGPVDVKADVPVKVDAPASQPSLDVIVAPAPTTQLDQPPAAPAQPAYDSQLAILKALSDKQITVEEAEQLLRSLAR